MRAAITSALAALAVGLAACGGSAHNPTSAASTARFVPGEGTPPSYGWETAAKHESKRDRDNDNDNPTRSYYDSDDDIVLRERATANAATTKAISNTISHYYQAAVAGDGLSGCRLINSVIAESLAEEDGKTVGAHGRTCSAVMAYLFNKHHRQFAAELKLLEVKGARLENNHRGWALLDFGRSKNPGLFLVHRDAAGWRVDELFRTEMP